jgi:predicted RNA-binding protein
MSLRTASSGLHGPAARNQGISQLHAHTIVIYTANVLAIFICIQGRILNRSSLKQRIPTIRNLAILRNCVLLTDREEERNTESKKLKNGKNVFGFYFGAGVHNSKVSGRSGDYVLHDGT